MNETTTQVEKVRAHLQAGKGITPVQAMTVYGISRLSSVIEDLRLGCQGLYPSMKVDTVMKRDEAGKQYAEYRLHKPIEVGCQVQVRIGRGIGLPSWVRKMKLSTVVEKREDASFVEFIRGTRVGTYWVNDSEVVRVSA